MKKYPTLVLLALTFWCFSIAVADPAPVVSYDWFEYVGKDRVFSPPLPKGQYRNPILAGFYPDPSVVRAGDKFYLVNSTFAYFPGIPVFESTDLVHWTPLGHVLDRAGSLNFDGLSMSRGVFAPTIHHQGDTFYVLNTLVDSGGNFIVTAKNPAGPWSDPIWLKEIDGIDPSMFGDDDGRAYLLNNGPPEGKPLYEGHRAIWMQELSLKTLQPIGPRKVVLNGGVDIAKKPIWIEGPHLFKRGEWYYLMCAEGGTGPNHSEVILRARTVWGPFEPYSGNPILSQRTLPADRADPVINAGHADLVEAPDGSWWAVFLGSRPYDGKNYHTGRETYLLPVKWHDDWPMILAADRSIPYSVDAPTLPASGKRAAELAGNFTWRDEFKTKQLSPEWLQIRVPREPWYELNGKLRITPKTTPLDALSNPSYLGRRQQHLAFEASTVLTLPESSNVAAGIAAVQSEKYWYFFGARRAGDSLQLFVEKKGGAAVTQIATRKIASSTLALKMSGAGRNYSFSYSLDGGTNWQSLLKDDDGSILSTEVAGGFVGTTLGPYARLEPQLTR